MRFLADESCNFLFVSALRSAGHDVVAVCEISPRADDTRVLKLAFHDMRILLTEDKDFGTLVFSHGQKSPGVILLRYPSSAGSKISREIVNLVNRRGNMLLGCFIVVQPGRIRIT